jgi:hypothetical protein
MTRVCDVPESRNFNYVCIKGLPKRLAPPLDAHSTQNRVCEMCKKEVDNVSIT